MRGAIIEHPAADNRNGVWGIDNRSPAATVPLISMGEECLSLLGDVDAHRIGAVAIPIARDWNAAERSKLEGPHGSAAAILREQEPVRIGGVVKADAVL